MEEQDLELFRKYRETGDRAIRNQLVERYQRTAAIIAKKFVGRGVDYDDLLQIASEALILGIEKYDPDRDNDFPAYITPSITGRIKNYFRDYAKSIKLPRKLYAVSKRVKQCTEEYLRTHEKRPTVRQLAEMLDVSEEMIVQALEFRPPLSLDAPVIAESEETGTTNSDNMQDTVDPYDDFDEGFSMKEEIRQLTPREQQIVKLRFIDGKSQAETGKALGLSQMFISRLEKRIIEKLKKSFNGEDTEQDTDIPKGNSAAGAKSS
ncbi:MAG: sigma-70 family RNA polymerase sigma factor [Clostridia bacterium]|nr:sigma-70 family RNA polymerase sigma factor [Clostridia bacterium]